MVKVLILSQFNYQTFPIVPGMILVDQKDLDQIGKTRCFDITNNCVIPYTPEQSEDNV